MALVFFLPLLTACSAPPPPPAAPGGPAAIAIESRMLDGGRDLPAVGQPAPDFAYTLADGTTTTLSALRGRRVLINFWATWCEPCREEMPDLQRIADRYADDLVVLGINKLEQPDLFAPFAEELGVRFLLIANPAGDISDRYGAKNIPLTFVIDGDGTIVARQLGIMSYEAIEQQISSAGGLSDE
jgi:thiol-disulfide isomerase/thioredoxin